MKKLTTISQAIAEFRKANPCGYLKVTCQQSFAGQGNELAFAATTNTDEKKGFGVEFTVPCDSFDEALEGLAQEMPKMFGYSDAPAEQCNPSAAPAPTGRAARRASKTTAAPATPTTAPTAAEFVPMQGFGAQASVATEKPLAVQQPAAPAAPRTRVRRPANITDEAIERYLLPESVNEPVSPAQTSVFDAEDVAEMTVSGEQPNIAPVENAPANPESTSAEACENEPVVTEQVEESAPVSEPAAPVAATEKKPVKAPARKPAEELAAKGLPLTPEEKLERALEVEIPATWANGGLTLGQLVMKYGDVNGALRELRWMAFEYSGTNLELKEAAALVYQFVKENATQQNATA